MTIENGEEKEKSMLVIGPMYIFCIMKKPSTGAWDIACRDGMSEETLRLTIGAEEQKGLLLHLKNVISSYDSCRKYDKTYKWSTKGRCGFEISLSNCHLAVVFTLYKFDAKKRYGVHLVSHYSQYVGALMETLRIQLEEHSDIILPDPTCHPKLQTNAHFWRK